MYPSLYLYNARIHTLDPEKPLVSALAIRDGKVIAAGSDPGIQSEFGERMEGIDLQGRIILPGLTDAHLHLEHYALGLKRVDCETRTRQECLERVAERARNAGPGEWILGHGWNQNEWPEGFGSATDLDTAAPANPVYLTAKSLHAGWANSAALALAHLDERSPDPAGGKIGRQADGRLSGILFESAMEVVAAAAPEPDPEQVAAAIRDAQGVLWRMGITGVHDFDRRRCFQALQLLHERGELGLRVLKSIPLEDLPSAAAMGLRAGFGDDWLKIGPVKAFADGALGPQTAAMFQPYQGFDDNRGLLLLDSEELFEQGRAAVTNGFSLAVHAIGDRAVHEVLGALEQLRTFEKSLPSRDRPELRHRIEHVQLVHPDDASRLAELNVIASMQPVHATSDMLIADRYWGERARLSYAWKLQLEWGARLAFGSDAPVESPNPFLGLHAAVTRRRLDGSPGVEGWMPEQRVSLRQALEAYTSGAAFAAGWEDRSGRLAPGCWGDLIVLDVDPFECSPDELPELKPAATMAAGEWVYRG